MLIFLVLTPFRLRAELSLGVSVTVAMLLFITVLHFLFLSHTVMPDGGG